MIGPFERRKDAIQLAVESAFSHVGQIATIITEAGRGVTREIGDWATDMFEIRDAARRAQADEARRGELEGHEPPEVLGPGAQTAPHHELRRPLRRP